MTERVDADQAYQEMATVSPLFRKVWAAEIEEWKDDGGVMGTIMFGHFARALAEQIDLLDPPEMAAIFDKLDDLLLRGNQQVRNIVATGFLEALISVAAYKDFEIERVKPFIGPEAVEYCEAWSPRVFRGEKFLS